MIIAVDYDGTLVTNGTPNVPLLNRLKAAQRGGDIVILWTCREGKRLTEAVCNLKGWGLRPDAINANHPAGIARLGYDSRKVFADLYIDDKGVRPP